MQRAEIVNMLEEKFDRGDYMRYTVWNSMILTRLWNYVDRPFVHKYLGKLIPTMKIKTGLLIFTLLFEDLIHTKSPVIEIEVHWNEKKWDRAISRHLWKPYSNVCN